jgi:hypothetical protein
LERIADHATNIGEWSLYWKVGRLEKINPRDAEYVFERWREVGTILRQEITKEFDGGMGSEEDSAVFALG